MGADLKVSYRGSTKGAGGGEEGEEILDGAKYFEEI